MRFPCLFILLFLCSSGGTFAQSKELPRRTRELYDNAQTAWKARKMEAALPLFQKLAELEPNLPEVHLRLGQIYELQRQPARARYHYKQMVRLDPAGAEAANAYQWLGRDTFQRERYDSAQVYLAQALTRYPERSNLALVTRKRFNQSAVSAAV